MELLKKWWKLAAVALILLSGYLTWCWYGPKAPKPGTVVQAVESPKIATMEKRSITPKHVMVIADKAKAVDKLGLTPAAIRINEELLTAPVAPATRYGSTTAVFLNTSTGQTRSIDIIKPAPWFALERTNYLGGSIGASIFDGTMYRGYYRRDILQIKGVYLQGEGQAISKPDSRYERGDLIGWMNLEYRW